MLIKDFLVVTVVFVCFLCIGKHLRFENKEECFVLPP